MTHTHQCKHCGHIWDCFLDPKTFKHPERCPVTKAAKANHQGPYCSLCRILIEAIFAANIRLLPRLEQTLWREFRKLE